METSLVSALVESQFPELTPVRARRLGEGCDSVAFEVNERWVFRFPKTDDTARGHEIERVMLPLLSERLALAIPQVRFRGVPSSMFSRGFMGYLKLPGDPIICLDEAHVPLDALVKPVAQFLADLHAFPVNDAMRCGVPTQALTDLIDEIRMDALDDLPRIPAIAPDAPADGWRRFIDAGVSCGSTHRPVLIHNDFAAEHILFDVQTQQVTGVIDWSDMAIGDPIADFAGLFHWGGEPFARAVVDLYTGDVDPHGLHCARYMAACRGVMDVAFGLDHHRPEYVAAGLRALRLSIPPLV
jgi:aminoglycoside phosphotransferase (APT) family kinase protein